MRIPGLAHICNASPGFGFSTHTAVQMPCRPAKTGGMCYISGYRLDPSVPAPVPRKVPPEVKKRFLHLHIEKLNNGKPPYFEGKPHSCSVSHICSRIHVEQGQMPYLEHVLSIVSIVSCPKCLAESVECGALGLQLVCNGSSLGL